MSLQRDSVQLDVTIAGEKAGKTLRDLANESKSLQTQLSQLAPGTEEFVKKSQDLQKVNTRLTAIRSTTRGGLKEIKESADAINRFGEEGGKKLIDLRNKSRELEQQLATLEPTSKAFADTAKQYAQVNDEIVKIEGSVGSLGNEFSSIPGPIGGVIKSIKGATVAAKAFIATPLGLVLGAIALALAAVRSALTSSEEGQEKLNKSTIVFANLAAKLNDLLAALGDQILRVFTEPEELIKDLGATIQNFFLNRIQDTLSGIKGLGSAISLLFKGEFKEAAKVGGQALLDLTTGLMPAAGIIKDTSDAIKDFTKDLQNVGTESVRVAEMRNKADRLERDLIIERAKIEAKVADLRLKARQEEEFSAEERRKFLQEAGKLQDELFGKENKVLSLRAEAIKLENTFSRTTKESKREEAEAVAALARAEAARLNTQRQLQREINTLNKQSEKERKDELDIQANIYKEYLQEIEILNNQQQLQLRINRAQGLVSEKEYQEQLAELQLTGLDQRLEILRAFGKEETKEFLELQAERAELFREIQDKERNDQLKTIEEQIREEERLIREQFLRELITEQEFQELKKENALRALEERLEFLAEIGERETEAFRDLELKKLEIEKEIADLRIANAERETKAKQALQEQQVNNLRDIVGESINIIGEQGKEQRRQFGLVKAFEAAQIKLNAISEIQKIFNSFSSLGPIGQVLAVIQAAAAGVRAKRALSNLTSVSYNTGGISGQNPLTGQKITQSANVATQPGGDNILAYVKRGEVILNEDQQRKLGGAYTFRKIGVPGFSTGGLTTANTTPSPIPSVGNQAPAQEDTTNRELINEIKGLRSDFNQFPRQLKASVVLSEFEEVQDEMDDIRDQANL